MAFNSLFIGTDTYQCIGGSTYRLSTVPFGGLENDFRIGRGVKNKAGVTTASITHRVAKEPVTGLTIPRVMSVTVNFTVPDGFTVAETTDALSRITTWSTPANITRLFMGES